MAVHRTLEREGNKGQRRSGGLHPGKESAGAGPEAGRGRHEQRLEEREAVFDIADFAAIADFAGIGRVGQRGG